ncbi:MAG: hypothetical protein PUE18_05745 [Firmicutes bacterium]|nr:hypothetical protein [Bacillota bacterium]
MKKTLIFLSFILVLISAFASEVDSSAYQWNATKDSDGKITGGSGTREFNMYFSLSAGDNSTYTDVGFSSTPLNTTTGAVTKYENNSLVMNASINTSSSPYSIDLKCQTYLYWHVAIEGQYKIQLTVEPKDNVSVTFTNNSEVIQESDKPITSSKAFDIVSFSKLGRHLGSSLISIEANTNTASFPDDVVCVLTLSLVSAQ